MPKTFANRRVCLVQSLARLLKHLAGIMQESAALAGGKQDPCIHPQSEPEEDRWWDERGSAAADEEN